jgi:hypothetical protein
VGIVRQARARVGRPPSNPEEFKRRLDEAVKRCASRGELITQVKIAAEIGYALRPFAKLLEKYGLNEYFNNEKKRLLEGARARPQFENDL